MRYFEHIGMLRNALIGFSLILMFLLALSWFYSSGTLTGSVICDAILILTAFSVLLIYTISGFLLFRRLKWTWKSVFYSSICGMILGLVALVIGLFYEEIEDSQFYVWLLYLVSGLFSFCVFFLFRDVWTKHLFKIWK